MQICYIVMSSASEAKAGLKLCEVDSALPCQLDQTSVGLKKWTQEYIVARPNVSTLERDAVGVVSDYDLRQNLERLKTRKAGEPDEEGWITVTRKRRSNQLQVRLADDVYAPVLIVIIDKFIFRMVKCGRKRRKSWLICIHGSCERHKESR